MLVLRNCRDGSPLKRRIYGHRQHSGYRTIRKNPDRSATIVSLEDTQSLTIASVPIFLAPPAISMAAVPIVDTIVQNTNEDTGAAPSSGNAQVIVRRRGREKMIIQGTRVS